MQNHEKNEDSPDIVKIMHMLINDIETKGVKQINEEPNRNTCEFTDGIMHLLFKKKEKWKIANYRPITLLNTDYKTYTKTIALKLASVAETMIHEDQAGFVPKRSLYDHTKTTNLAIEYCEMMDKNGCIVALDQEKAYDKIDHDYLWEILEHYNFPEEFTKRIKELYKNAEKAIIVNGIVTKRYKVERGVHQGDPMSCLLYNFAIEPLANAIRESNLEGIKVNEKVNRLIVSLFADDTLVYLRETDDLNELRKIINIFCKASTARFNMEKTEYLPIGRKEYREKVIEERKFGENEIEEGVKIIEEGESMRTLGAWVGNETNAEIQWEAIIKKQEDSIKIWSSMNMSLKGKEIILKALIQSKAMFLATVNGMPNHIEKRMKKLFKDFLWDNKKGLMGWNQVIAKREHGGLGIPDIKARIDAIEIMWLKKWLSPDNEKPKWAYILDEILKNNIAKAPMIDKESRMDWLKQSWHESEAKNSKMSKGIRNLLKIARRYNVTLEPLKYSLETKMNEPLWHNRLMNEANYQWNKKSARCLRVEHEVKTIGDIIESKSDSECETKKACNVMKRRIRNYIPDVINPVKETPRKVRIKNLDLTPNRIQKNKENKSEKVFNPDITARGDIMKQVRIFNKNRGTKTRRAKITPKQPAYREVREEKEEETKAIIVILTQNQGKANQKTKVQINLSKGKEKEIKFQLEEKDQSKEKASAMAILWILKNEKVNRLQIITTDKKLVQWIGEDLVKEEDRNWTKTKETDLWKAVLNNLRKRNSITEIKSPVAEDKEKIKEITKKLREENVATKKIKIKKNESKYLQDGARLTSMTQKLAYELAIQSTMEKPGGSQTWRNIKRIKNNLEEKWNIRREEEKIWKDIEKINNKKIQDFVWKIIHDRIKCGKFFKHIPNWQEKQFCECGEVENLDHILFECEENKQKKLWEVVEKTWKKITKLEWKKITILEVMSMGSVKVKKGHSSDLMTEILITLISTAVWTIWKNRNDRIFNEEKETEEKQLKTWKRSLKSEIKMEFNQIKQAGKGKIEKATNRFIKKWSNETKLIRIEVNKKGKGKRRLRMEI
jgi:hypothetical protein